MGCDNIAVVKGIFNGSVPDWGSRDVLRIVYISDIGLILLLNEANFLRISMSIESLEMAAAGQTHLALN